MNTGSCRAICEFNAWCYCDCGSSLIAEEVCESRLGRYIEAERYAYREAFIEYYMERDHVEDYDDSYSGF